MPCATLFYATVLHVPSGPCVPSLGVLPWHICAQVSVENVGAVWDFRAQTCPVRYPCLCLVHSRGCDSLKGFPHVISPGCLAVLVPGLGAQCVLKPHLPDPLRQLVACSRAGETKLSLVLDHFHSCKFKT